MEYELKQFEKDYRDFKKGLKKKERCPAIGSICFACMHLESAIDNLALIEELERLLDRKHERKR